ncbi:hypothetical protein G6F68_020099 [Rhizopus microsporus]|nr:hypothetical protein G6F68_020099 [Rhizopus microsporus]
MACVAGLAGCAGTGQKSTAHTSEIDPYEMEWVATADDPIGMLAPTATTPWSAKPSTIWASATASAAVPPIPDSIAAAWSPIPPSARWA